MRQNTIYRNYEISRSVISRQWFAHPVNCLTSEFRLVAPDAAGIKQLVDEATVDLPLNPWELPYASQQLPVAA